MSMSIRSRKRFHEVTRKVWGQLFGIFMRKAPGEELPSVGGNGLPGRHEHLGVAGHRVRPGPRPGAAELHGGRAWHEP